jgi:hypothetical protein
MRVNVHTTTSSGNITVDADYNETIENVLVKCSLVLSDVRMELIMLTFNGRELMPTQRLDQIGFVEGGVLVLRERKKCCSLL